MQRLTMPLGVLAFWVGMLMAARCYPSEYDWRYVTISSLVYPDRNPGGYLWARAGIALCGLAGLYWMASWARSGDAAGTAGPKGSWPLAAGYLCMTCCAVLPEGRWRIPRAHDLLALAAFVGICLGIVQATVRALPPWARRGLPAGPQLLAGLALSPLVAGALAETYVSHALPTLPWVSLVWRARGVPAYLSFAFWEWIACGVFSLYTVLLSRATAAADPEA